MRIAGGWASLGVSVPQVLKEAEAGIVTCGYLLPARLSCKPRSRWTWPTLWIPALPISNPIMNP